MTRLPLPTSDGEFTAYYSARGLARLDFPGDPRPPVRATNNPPASLRKWHTLTTRALKEILAGRKPRELPPLDLSAGTEFQRRVWQVLRGITTGRTLSYAAVAEAVGSPKAARAVGGACGANPIPLLVPCHRVLAAGGAIGGFSGGLPWKRRLLAREGLDFLAVDA